MGQGALPCPPTSCPPAQGCFFLFFFSTGLVRLYIAGLPLRSCRTIGAPSVQGSLQCAFFLLLVPGLEPRRPQCQHEVPTSATPTPQTPNSRFRPILSGLCVGPDIQSQTFLYPLCVNLGFISGYYLVIQKSQGLLSEISICLKLRFRIRLIILRSTEEAVRGGYYGPGLQLPTERGA